MLEVISKSKDRNLTGLEFRPYDRACLNKMSLE